MIPLDFDAAQQAVGGLLPTGVDADTVLDAYARAVWSLLIEPGDAVAGALLARFGAAGALERVQTGDDRLLGDDRRHDMRRAHGRWMPRLDQREIVLSLARAHAAGVQLVVPSDPHWPASFADLAAHAPVCLWMRGDPRALVAAPGVAVVGARAASRYGEHVATEIAAELAADGITVVSGGAYGIDGAAHRAALHVDGRTVAFMAGGVERSYPSGNSALIDAIAQTGAVASEVPCGATPTKWRFLQRNRLIAAASAATIVVEAGWRSGSINTAAHAADLGRPLGAVPGPITSATSAGCHRVLREYHAACITGAADVKELIADTLAPTLPMPAAVRGDRADRPSTDDTVRVRDALSTRVWRSVDEVVRRSGVEHADVVTRLGLLLLADDVERGPHGWRVAAPGPSSRG